MRELKLSNVKVAGQSSGETNFNKVSLLLPFDGSDTATSTSDESDNSHTITFAGTAQLDTAQKKFGTASLLLDGDSDYIQVADHDSFDFGAGNFTAECWIRFAALGNNTIFSHWANGTASSMSYYLTYFNSSGILRLGYYLGSNLDTSYSWSPSTGTWYHIALERSGTTLKVYIDGTSVISVSASTTALRDSEDPFRVGVFNDGSTGSPSLDWYFNGHIDDLRITKGIARYGTNFTPPTSAHETTGGDGNLPVVLDADATGVRVDYDGTTNQERIAKAWANIDGTGPSLEDSYNVSSLTDTATGRYTLNFSTALSNGHYAWAGSAGNEGTTTSGRDVTNDGIRTTSGLPIRVTYFDSFNAAIDDQYVGIIVFGN
jgi:hypothetical protein